MPEQDTTVPEVEAFIREWGGDENPMRNCFRDLYLSVSGLESVLLEFVARPGISFSLRPRHENQSDRSMYAMIDVIDDDPAERWLSVCFYGDMITDPEERGEVVPGGLAGDDGYCFDMYVPDDALTAYLKDRLAEGCRNAAGR